MAPDAAARARSGKMETKTATIARPDTIVKVPGGGTITLPKRTQNEVTVFQKYNPRVVDARTGKRRGKKGRAFMGMQPPRQVPLWMMALSTFVGYKVFTLIRSRFMPGWRQRHQQQPEHEQQQPGETGDEVDCVSAQQRSQQHQQQHNPQVGGGMLPTMLRQVLRRPGGRPAKQRQPTRSASARGKKPKGPVAQRKPSRLEQWTCGPSNPTPASGATLTQQQQRQT